MSNIRNDSKASGGKARKLEVQAREKIGLLRRDGTETRDQKLQQLGVIAAQMAKYGLKNMCDVKQKHVQRLFDDLREGRHETFDRHGKAIPGEKLDTGTLANYARTMRVIAEAYGKPQIVPENKDLGALRTKEDRTSHAGKELNAGKWSEIRAEVKPWVRAAMDLVTAFDLRREEALRSHQVVNRDGVPTLIIEGAKGGRPNEKAILLEEQRQAVAAAQAIRDQHGGTLAPGKYDLEQACKAFSNAIAYRGGNIDAGCNLHAGRRDGLMEKMAAAGAAYAIHGSREELIADLAGVAQWAGHGRIEVLESYGRRCGLW